MTLSFPSKIVTIAPSILAADFTRLGEQVREAERAGAGQIHIDVMDGRFVPNITMGNVVVEAVKRAVSIPLDVHLMIVEPDTHLEAFARAGAGRINVHWETCPHLHRTLNRIHELGCTAGVAINPHIPAAFLDEIIHLVDAVLVMTVNPGFGGQKFLPETLPKIRNIRALIDAQDRPIDLVVDGGITTETAHQAVEAGANVLVVGSVIFNTQHTIEESMGRLRVAFEKDNSAGAVGL